MNSHPSLPNGHFDLFVPLASGHHFLLYLIRHHGEAEPYNVVVVVIFFSGGGGGGAELVFFHMYYNYFYSFRLPCPVVPVSDPEEEGFDCYILVCENLEWDNSTWNFLKKKLRKTAEVYIAVKNYKFLKLNLVAAV